MNRKQRLEKRLRQLEEQRAAVQTMDEALKTLTPEERLVLEHLVIAPRSGSGEQLCQMLGLELSSVYRRKDRALQRLAAALGLKVG